MKVLIVDDNPTMRSMIRSIVTLPEDAVTECSDGIDAVESYRAAVPDVVLMDLQMPLMNGIRATRALKQAFPEAHVIILSQFNDPEFREEARAANAASYFTKDDLLRLKEFIHP